MVRLSDLKAADQVHREVLDEPEYRREYERTAFAHAVASRIVEFRAAEGLSQSALARKLGMKQPAIARLEGGDHEPALTTLSRIARGLGIEFHIHITPSGLELRSRG
ncbi:MAG TPA: helix-turn-helix transcriptional regulator [Actinomycetospora sp.]|jgi:ribosome-binding protein aMBF1 (putative translation factor)|uniref:helix-turn-helix domain-containing protein n=1 Tax=Actinomycetospora sp. TaxID=1872135 RepID=UPI002F3E7DD1